MKKQRTLLKKFLIWFGVLLLIAVIGIGFVGYQVLSQLPSPQQIGKMMKGEDSKKTETSDSSAGVSGESKTAQPSEYNDNKIEELKKLAKIEDDRRVNKLVERSIFDFNKPLVNVCENLKLARESQVLAQDAPAPKNEDDFMLQVGNAIDRNEDDPFVESMMTSLRYVIRLPKSRELFETIDQVKGDSDRESTMAEKALFYGKAALAYREMQSKKKEINDYSMRSYHLFVLSNAARESAELVNAPEMQEYCERIQKSMNEDVPFDRATENAELQKFLSWARISPEKVKFDPNLESNMGIEFTANALSMSLGWISELTKKAN